MLNRTRRLGRSAVDGIREDAMRVLLSWFGSFALVACCSSLSRETQIAAFESASLVASSCVSCVVWISSDISSFVMCAGLSRSIDIFAFRLPRSTMKYFSYLFVTLYGPSYGGCSGVRTASIRTKTCVQICMSRWMNVCCFCLCVVCVGLSVFIVFLSSLTYSDCGLTFDSSKMNSPGKRSVEP